MPGRHQAFWVAKDDLERLGPPTFTSEMVELLFLWCWGSSPRGCTCWIDVANWVASPGHELQNLWVIIVIIIIVIVIIIIWAWKYMQTHKPYLLTHEKLKGPSARAPSCQLCLEDYTWFCWFGGTSLSALCRCSGLRLTLQLPEPLDLGKLTHIERFPVLLSYSFVYVWK